MRQHVGQAVDEDLVDAFFQYPAQFIADHSIGQWADAGDEVGQFGHVFAFGEGFVAVLFVHQVVDDHADETLGQLVHFLADQAHMGEYRVQRHAGFAEFLAGVVDARVGQAQAHAFGNDVAELDRLGHHFRGDVFAEVIQQILVVHVGGDAGGLPGSNGHFQAENIVELTALFPGAEQIADVVEGVTAFQQGADDFQACQMHIRVDTRAAALFRGRQDAAVLVGTHVTHRRAGFAGQFVDGEFLVVAGVSRGLLFCRLSVFFQAAQNRCGITVTGFHVAMIAPFLHWGQKGKRDAAHNKHHATVRANPVLIDRPGLRTGCGRGHGSWKNNRPKSRCCLLREACRV